MSPVILGLGDSISSTDVAVIDSNSEAMGVPRLLLMENAGRSVADIVAERVRPGGLIVVYAGSGGNGGDGLAAARHLALRGYRVKIVMATRPEQLRSPEARVMFKSIEMMDYSIDVVFVKDPCTGEPLKADAVVDALLGVGLRGAPRPPYSSLIEAINNSQASLKVAIDVPSGLDADTGETPGVYVKADITVTLHKPKPGLIRRRDAAGEIIVSPIGVPPEAEIYVGPGDVRHRVPRRSWETRKGRGGRLLVVAGSVEYVGAAILAALAAEAAGVDLVYIASTRNVIEAAMSQRPTLVPIVLEGGWLEPKHVDHVAPIIERVDAVVTGMGLGLREETGEALRLLLEATRRAGRPIVLDADALKLLRHVGLGVLQGVRAVLTPHDGEFMQLFGKKPASITCIPARVHDAAEASTKTYGATILLKGPVDVIAEPSRARLNKTGAPAMSVGGTGDLLAGLVGGLISKGMDLFHAASVAAYVNGAAGALAYREKGESMTALDVVERIPLVIHEPEKYMEKAVVYHRLPLRSDCKGLW